MLLTRDEFRNAVFKRDNHRCVVCNEIGQDSHHIMDRRLFADGGYYLDNGSLLCSTHHLLAEQTILTVEQIREAAKIKKIILPEHLYDDQVYDKWANPILPNGMRLRGELFFDESVQKILAPILGQFTHYVKFPRTHHLPWSLGVSDDDRVHTTTSQWEGKRVVASLKFDGENTTMYKDYIHARSIDGRSHPSRSWVKNFWSGVAHDIPEYWRVTGESLFAKHSLGYTDLPSYFLGFGLWNERNYCMNWGETLEFFQLLGITPVSVIYDGIYDEDLIRDIKIDYNTQEGYVLRTWDGFSYADYRKYVGKVVRPNHVTTKNHWMHGPMETNKLKD